MMNSKHFLSLHQMSDFSSTSIIMVLVSLVSVHFRLVDSTDSVSHQSCSHSFSNNQLCPDLFSKQSEPNESENKFKKIHYGSRVSLNLERFDPRQNVDPDLQQIPCNFHNNVTLLWLGSSGVPWDFTGSQRCTQFYEFSQRPGGSACETYRENSFSSLVELHWKYIENNESSIKILYKNVSDTEFASVCQPGPKLLVLIFKELIQTHCSLFIQQSVISPTKQECRNISSSTIEHTCGRYECSEENDIFDKLTKLRKSFSHSEESTYTRLTKLLTPTLSFQTKEQIIRQFEERQERRNLKKAQEWKMSDYILEITIIVVFVLIVGLIFLKMCLSQTFSYSLSHSQRHTPAASRRASQASLNPYYSKPLTLPPYGPILKCSSKPSCVCSDPLSRGKRWSHREEGAYAPTLKRKDDASQPFISKA